MSETVAPPSEQRVNTAEAHYEARRLVKMEKLKDAVGELTRQRDDAIKERDSARKEVEAAQKRGDTSALAKQNQELHQRLRIFEHRKVLDRLAMEKGLNPDALEAFYKLSEYQAEGDEVDETEVGAFIDAKKAEHPYLFGKAEPAQVDGKVVKPAVGSGQNSPKTKGKPTGDDVIIPDDDPRWNDSVWQMLNQDKVIASAKEKVRRGLA